MTIGLQVLNDSSTYQIDETFKNFQLTNSQTGAVTSSLYNDGSSFYYYYDYVIYNAVNPVLAIYCANRAVVVIAISKSGSTWTFRVVCEFNNAALELYTFDVSTTSPTNYGLQIFNSSAELVYHSGNKPLRIVAFLSNYAAGPFTYTSGRKYAFVILSPGFFQSSSEVAKAVKVDTVGFSALTNTSPHILNYTTIITSVTTVYSYDPPINFPADLVTALVVDITNF